MVLDRFCGRCGKKAGCALSRRRRATSISETFSYLFSGLGQVAGSTLEEGVLQGGTTEFQFSWFKGATEKKIRAGALQGLGLLRLRLSPLATKESVFDAAVAASHVLLPSPLGEQYPLCSHPRSCPFPKQKHTT